MKIAREFRPWIWCIAWLIFFVVIISFLTKQFYEIATMPNCKIEYELLSKKPPSTLNSPMVIALGDSLLKHATPKTQWLNENIRWYRANIPAAQQRQFIPIFPALEKVRPSLLLVQDTLLLKKTKIRWDTRAKITIRYLVSLFFPLSKDPCNKAMDTWKETVRDPNKMIKLYDEEYSRSMLLSDSSKQWLLKLKELSEKIIVVHFPRSIEQSKSDVRVNWLENMETELSKLDIEIISIGESLDGTYYRDGAHVNRKGRELRMRQLNLLIESSL